MIDINATFLGIDLFVYVVLAILLIPSYYLWKWII
mgnify:FL=1